MPINVFGNSSSSYDNKIDTSLFVQKPYLRTNYIESNIEEEIDLKNQFRIKKLPDSISIGEPVSKSYVDNKFNDPSKIKNTAHIDLNERNITNARFIQVNQLPQIDSHLTAKLYVDNAISDGVNESSLLRLDRDEKLEQDSIILNSTLTSPKTILEIPTKNYVDNKFNDSSIIKNTDHVDFNDKILVNVHSINVNSYPTLDEQLTPKFYVDHFVLNCVDEESLVRLDPKGKIHYGKLDSIFVNTSVTSPRTIIELPTKSYVDSLHRENERSRRDLGLDFYDESSTLVRFNQTLQNYSKVSVGNDTYNLTKYNKISITDITEIKVPNSGNALLQKWKIYCNNKNIQSRISDFIKSTKTNSPTGFSGATSLSPIGDAFMYIETSSNNHGPNVFVSWERTDIIQISNITFYYNRFSILTNDILKNMGRFKIQLLLEDDTWSTQYTIDKNTQYSDSESEWKLLNLDFTVENYGIKLILDQIDTAHSDMCFSNITITHSVY